MSKICVLRGVCRSYALRGRSPALTKVTHRPVSSAAAAPQPSSLRSALKLCLAGASTGLLIGVGYSIYKLNQPHRHIVNAETKLPIVSDVPKIEPSRKIRIASDTSGLKITLYQYQTCPFCCKVRAFLDYYGISYDLIEIDPVLRQSIKWTSYKKVPIVVAEIPDGYQTLNDSSMIVSALASYLQVHAGNEHDSKDLVDIVNCYPMLRYMDEDGREKNEVMNRYFLMLEKQTSKRQAPKEINEERKWRKWADDVLVHMLSPNVYRTRTEAYQAFNWFSDIGEWEKNFPTWERLVIINVGALAMWMIGKRLKQRHNLKDDVRQSLYDECNYFTRAIKAKGTEFIGGDRPNLADLAVYGVLSSIEGCDAFKDLLANTNIKGWFYTMKNEVTNHRGAVI